MAYDERLAGKIRDRIGNDPSVTEKKMFGGIAFMHNGNMAVGVSGDEMMVRVGPEAHDDALTEPGVRDFDLSGKKMKGWVLVSAQVTSDEEDLVDWIDVGMQFSGSLPPK